MASIDNALTTLARAKAYLEISGTSKDAVLTMLILGASQFAEKYCRRKFKRQAYTNELYDGKDISRIWLKNSPVIEGETFSLERIEDIDSDDDWDGISSDDYQIDYEKGYIQKRVGNWVEGNKNYRISYTAGFYLPSDSEFQDGTNDDQDLPYDLEIAVLDLVSIIYTKRKAAGIERQKVFQIDITFSKSLADNPTLKATLDQYKKTRYA